MRYYLRSVAALASDLLYVAAQVTAAVARDLEAVSCFIGDDIDQVLR